MAKSKECSSKTMVLATKDMGCKFYDFLNDSADKELRRRIQKSLQSKKVGSVEISIVQYPTEENDFEAVTNAKVRSLGRELSFPSFATGSATEGLDETLENALEAAKVIAMDLMHMAETQSGVTSWEVIFKQDPIVN